MVDQDLKTLFGEQAHFKINGKEHALKELDVESHLMAEFKAQTIEAELKQTISDVKEIKAISKKIREYITTIFEITPAEASKVTFNDYKRIRKWLTRQDLYDQGFNDEEINKLEKESIQQAAFRALKEDTSAV